MSIVCVYPTFIKRRGPAYACQSVIESIRLAGQDAELYCVTAEREMLRTYHHYVMPYWGQRAWFRIFSPEFLCRQVEWRFRFGISPGDLAYIWPGTTLATYRQMRTSGHAIVIENINTHMATSKAILDQEYKRLGLVPTHGITDQMVAEENAKLQLVDLVFSPSDQVTKSLRDAGVSDDKIVSTSYGLDAEDMLSEEDVSVRGRRDGPPNAIFVGRIGIRKGAPLLLDYWVKAGVKGTLKLVGDIEADARHLIAPYLGRPDIQHIPFTFDLKSIYREADVFLFPSLEEGSPLVTNLSMGAGLPSLVSPMGAGGIVRNGVDGLVIDPHDADGWVSAIRFMFNDADARQRMGMSAFGHAREYLWPVVGRKRLLALRSSPALRGCDLL